MKTGCNELTSKNYRLIYTYSYAPDSEWELWRSDVYSDDKSIDSEQSIPLWIYDDAKMVIGRLRTGKLLRNYLLLADSHFTYNGTWDDTVTAMRELGKRLPLSGIIHLGDLTDGLLPLVSTMKIEKQCIDDMNGLGVPVYFVPGNHDYNYFRGNPEIKYPSTPQYYIDESEQRLRLVFLDSFDPKEELRYGFTEYCIHWVDAVLNMMPEDYVAIIFSHVPPIKQLHVWSDWIRNSHILMSVLDKYADRILAYINGHSHCDHLFNGLHNGQFPVISINCAKCEYFLEHKPKGAVVPFRRLGDRTQESFDIMQVDTEKREIYFTRFGAGQDRAVINHKAVWV